MTNNMLVDYPPGKLQSADRTVKVKRTPQKELKPSSKKIKTLEKPVNAKEDIIEIRDILCIRKPGQTGYQNYRQILRKVNSLMEENQQLTRQAFATVIHHLFPEINDVKKFSAEG